MLKKELQYRPWKPHYVHELKHEDCDRRMAYSEHMLQRLGEAPGLLDRIIWSDEAIFHVGGFVNRHNSHYWGPCSPGATVERLQSRPKVTVWCGMTSTSLVGPYLLEDTMNSSRYLCMLEDYVMPIISQWPSADDLIFMQDGAPPHYARSVRNWLDDTFPGRWLGRRGPMEWPARSPDLTPCDFFLWGWAKEEVYKTNPRTGEELKDRIKAVMDSVPTDFLRKAVEDVPKRWQRCVDNAGAYVEF